jgi:hypothetical protein
MLDPYERQLAFEMLRPPSNYELDFAIGTTYSLDLVTLLTAPLAFTFFEWEDRDGQPTADPVALLEALRRNASRMRIFHQSGQIHVPSAHQTLFHYLEDILIPAKARAATGVFHPKLWILRYVNPGEPVRYRLICSTRNLTNDRSWDTALVLDGMLTDRKKAVAANHPLGDFVRQLHEFSLKQPDSLTLGALDKFQHELRRVTFELPEDVEGYRFWPIGHSDRSVWPFTGRIDRLLVASPFTSDSALMKLAEDGDNHVLIASPDALEKTGQTALNRFADIYTISSAALEATPDTAEAGNGKVPLSGLHAKLYIAEGGWDARVWIGSANATHAAFERNAEFLVELCGKKSRLGIDAFLNGDNGGSAGVLSILEPYAPSADRRVDAIDEELDSLIQATQRALSEASLIQRVTELDQAFHCTLILRNALELPGEIKSVQCWPISVPARQVPFSARSEVAADFGQMAFESLTAFVAFRITVVSRNVERAAEFVLAVPLDGAPQDRKERLFRHLLSDRQQLMRLLLMLLSRERMDILGLFSTSRNRSLDENGLTALSEHGLFETLVECLAHSPSQLPKIDQVLQQLGALEDAAKVLPEGFFAVWDPVWQAYQERVDKK